MPAGDDTKPARAHHQLSPLFMAVLAIAVAATLALVIIVVLQRLNPPPPPPGSPFQPGNPPPRDTPIILGTAVFVLSWIAVMLTYARDLIMSRINTVEAAVRGLRTGLADDRRDELADLSARIIALTSEFGDQRETDGYLNGMRQAGKRPTGQGGGPRLHPVPPAE